MQPTQLESYLPVLIQVIVAAVLAVTLSAFSVVLGRRMKSPQKDTPYECGIAPTGDAKDRFSVKFYLVAMIFILLDIEAVFLYPWAVVYRKLKMFGFVEMVLFIGLVLVGYFYVWKKGALDWSIPQLQRKPIADADTEVAKRAA
jgi:NADH-quinone oxidoreductase subunit A